MTIENHGTIAASDDYGTLSLRPTTFVNDGLMVSDGYRSTLSVESNTDTAWTNASDGVMGSFGGNTLELGGAGTNDGTIWAQGGGTVNLDALYNYGGTAATFTNDGVVTAVGSTINQSGDLAGSGAILLNYNSTLNVNGSVGADQRVVFDEGVNSALNIAHPDQFLGFVEGFRYEDTISLAGVAADGATYTAETGTPTAGGVLTLTEGGVAVGQVRLAGDYTQAHFTVATGSGGATTLTTDAGPVFDGKLTLSGPSGFDYVNSLLPTLDQAIAGTLTELGGGRETYTVSYANHMQVAFTGAGLTLGAGGQFDPAGGTVDTVVVTDTTLPNLPVTLATYAADGTAHELAFAFDARILQGGEAGYERLLSGNNEIVGGPEDDVIRDDWGSNVINGGGGRNTLEIGPDVVVDTIRANAAGDGVVVTFDDPPSNEGTQVNPLVDQFGKTIFDALYNGLNNLGKVPDPSAPPPTAPGGSTPTPPAPTRSRGLAGPTRFTAAEAGRTRPTTRLRPRASRSTSPRWSTRSTRGPPTLRASAATRRATGCTGSRT